MSSNNSQKMKFAGELKATMTGSDVVIGTLEFAPSVIVFDNLSDQEVEISVSTLDAGTTVWKTFAAGSALVLDIKASNPEIGTSFDVGTTFIGNGASGDFSISYIYSR